MTQDKMRKIITACVVAGTTLLVFLLTVLIYQWITIGVYNKRIEKAQAENAELTAQAESGEALAKYYEEQGRFWLALEQGWIKAEKGE